MNDTGIQLEGFNEVQLAQIKNIMEEVLAGKQKKIDTESVTVTEAAELLNKSDSYIRKMISNRIIIAYKEKGFVTRIPKSELAKI